MANPFMNPNKRGFELPEGCKDLIDILQQSAATPQEPVTAPPHLIVETDPSNGTLRDVDKHLERLFASKGDHKFVAIFYAPKRRGLTVFCQDHACKLTFLFEPLDTFSMDSVENIFGTVASVSPSF